jgi:CRP/FNR family transcriptional regulator, cyclic AMP receptor protein
MSSGLRPPPTDMSILEADPDLGADLDPFARAQVARRVRVVSFRLPPGSWEPPADLEPSGGLGMLVVEGVLIRDVVMGDLRSTELIAKGDVVEPADLWTRDRLFPLVIEWTLLEDVRVAMLDARFLAAAAHWPQLVSALFERVAERSFRLATHAAICQLGRVELRVLSVMWHMAERWGRMSSEGLVLPLRLSHATLGRLIGARRPTVSLALKELTGQGDVARRSDGTWLLLGPPPRDLRNAEAAMPTPPRHPLLASRKAESDAG